MSTIQFTIQRDPSRSIPEHIEYWVYEEVMGAEERGNYVVIRMADRSAFIPKIWVTEVRDITGVKRD